MFLVYGIVLICAAIVLFFGYGYVLKHPVNDTHTNFAYVLLNVPGTLFVVIGILLIVWDFSPVVTFLCGFLSVFLARYALGGPECFSIQVKVRLGE